MAPSKVVLFRHGEKADGDGLTPLGYYRAFLLSNLLSQRYPSMKGIYAAGTGPGDSSVRKIQTVTPLINKMLIINPGLAINTVYINFQYKEAAHEILTAELFTNRIVLVCWSHTSIPPFAKTLGAINVPHKWPGNRFDMIWEIDMYTKELIQIPQLLLPGDTNIAIR
ncbi:MAG TPA: histidine phosphatase family protein [Bacillales bacterium]|nr:histidine phosphatase family protein [Bacillales bacterium]